MFSDSGPKTSQLVRAFNRGFAVLDKEHKIKNGFKNFYLNLSQLDTWQDITPQPN